MAEILSSVTLLLESQRLKAGSATRKQKPSGNRQASFALPSLSHGAPSVQAARGHGLARATVTLRYVLPLAAHPLVSLAGLSIATLLSASLLIEVVMGWPGLGPLLVDALLARDVHVVLSASMLASALLVIGNLAADLTLYALDPRIRV